MTSRFAAPLSILLAAACGGAIAGPMLDAGGDGGAAADAGPTPCGDASCPSGQVCVVNTFSGGQCGPMLGSCPTQMDYNCAPAPAGCDGGPTCGCASELCGCPCVGGEGGVLSCLCDGP